MLDIIKEQSYDISTFCEKVGEIYEEAQQCTKTANAFDDEDFDFIDKDGESEIEVHDGETTMSFGRKKHERYVYYWLFVHLLLKSIHDDIKYMKTDKDNEKQVTSWTCVVYSMV